MNKKIVPAVISVASGLILTGSAFAQWDNPLKKWDDGTQWDESTSTKPLPPIRKEIQENIKNVRENVKIEIQKLRTDLKDDMRKQTDGTRELIKQKREEFKETVKEKREEAKQKIEAKREEMKKKLETIKDERKKKAVEKINQEFLKINENRTEHFTENVDKIAKVLENIVARTDKAAANGKDVAAVRTAITAAEGAIAAARTAITEQATKTYTPTVNTEATLKSDVGVARQALQADLKKVHDAVKAAHDAVRKVATTLAQIPGVNQENTATTTSATQ